MLNKGALAEIQDKNYRDTYGRPVRLSLLRRLPYIGGAQGSHYHYYMGAYPAWKSEPIESRTISDLRRRDLEGPKSPPISFSRVLQKLVQHLSLP